MKHKKKKDNPFSIGRDQKTGKFVSLNGKKRGVKVETYQRPTKKPATTKKKRTPKSRRPLPFIMRTPMKDE